MRGQSAETPVRRNYQNLIKNPPSQSVQKQPQSTNSSNYSWDIVLQYCQNQDYDKAYSMVFQMDDDLYLIRLMSLSGPCVNKLSQKVAYQLAFKIKLLLKSEFWKVLGCKIFNQLSSKQEVLKIEQKQKIQSLLYKWSKSWQPEVSKDTALLYNSQLFKPDHII